MTNKQFSNLEAMVKNSLKRDGGMVMEPDEATRVREAIAVLLALMGRFEEANQSQTEDGRDPEFDQTFDEARG